MPAQAPVEDWLPEAMILLTEWERAKNNAEFKAHLEKHITGKYKHIPDDWIKMLKMYSSTRGIENRISDHGRKIASLEALLDVIKFKRDVSKRDGIKHEDTQASMYIKRVFG